MNNLPSFCDSLMQVVVRSIGHKLNDSNMQAASEIMKAETKAFFFGEDYRAERECLLAGTVHQNTVLASLTASCISKINAL